jgi:hypothetical protein
MTEISEAAKVEACERATTKDHAVFMVCDFESEESYAFVLHAFARFIQQVSDAAKEAQLNIGVNGNKVREHLAPFILPEPVDPLAEVLWGMDLTEVKDGAEKTAEVIRRALAKRGLKIVEATDAKG